MLAVSVLPAAPLASIETLLAMRQDVIRGLEQRAAGDTAELDAGIARLTATAQRLTADIARLLAELEARVPPDGEPAAA